MIKFYKVGGCVRDMILGVKSNDIDYTVTIKGDHSLEEGFEIMRNHLLGEGYEIFLENPECVTIRAKKNKEVADFVLAREEIGYVQGTRKPIVRLGRLSHDLIRRDFTVNAMAQDEDGNIIDMFGGEEDLENHILKTPLPAMQTFKDDPLRVLRAIRFAIRFDFCFSNEIKDAIRNPELPKLMKVVSKERIREELTKCFKCDTIKTLRLLNSIPHELLVSFFGGGLWLEPSLRKA